MGPDGGTHVYVVGDQDSALAAFGRNAATGKLTFVEVHRGGVGGVPAQLAFGGSVTISPDGANVYALGTDLAVGQAALAVFAPSRHRAAHVPRSQGGECGRSDGIAGASEAAVAPDGSHVHVAAAGDTLATFSRTPATGTLTLVDVQRDGVQGVEGINGNVTLAVSPDGRHIYSAGMFSWALAGFRPLTVECAATPLPRCRLPARPGKAGLKLRAAGEMTQPAFTWRWQRGSAATLAEFGDPVTTFTDYALCLYDESPASQPRLAAVVPAGAGCGKDDGAKLCWKPSATTFRYRDGDKSPDGVVSARLKAGADGQALVVVKGKGANTPVLSLPLAPPVVVQLQAANGECWAATYSTPTQNDAERFDAKAD